MNWNLNSLTKDNFHRVDLIGAHKIYIQKLKLKIPLMVNPNFGGPMAKKLLNAERLKKC